MIVSSTSEDLYDSILAFSKTGDLSFFSSTSSESSSLVSSGDNLSFSLLEWREGIRYVLTAYALTSSAKLGSDLSAVIFCKRKGTGVCSGSDFLGISYQN